MVGRSQRGHLFPRVTPGAYEKSGFHRRERYQGKLQPQRGQLGIIGPAVWAHFRQRTMSEARGSGD